MQTYLPETFFPQSSMVSALNEQHIQKMLCVFIIYMYVRGLRQNHNNVISFINSTAFACFENFEKIMSGCL